MKGIKIQNPGTLEFSRRIKSDKKDILADLLMTLQINMNSSNNPDVLIIGGGLAGLVNAIHLSRVGLHVMLIEKNGYPKHKVCGEYISNEVLPYLEYLGVDPIRLGAKKISRFQMSSISGKTIEAKLPMGGFSISRYTLDNYLLQKAIESQCAVVKAKVEKIEYSNDFFEVSTNEGKNIKAKIVIGAFGKRSNLDKQLDRAFIKKRSPYLAVKGHYKGDFPDDLVALHNFNGGYCGVSKVENDHLNICYLADYQSFKKFKSIDDFQEKVLFENFHLKALFENSETVFQKALTIGQISFLPKEPVDKHIFMSGDAAGMIHPLCGNGMAMAIHSAKILSGLVEKYFSGQIHSLELLEGEYTKLWNLQFRKRLLTGRIFQKFFRMNGLFNILVAGLNLAPDILPLFIRQTHGKPIIVEG